MQRRLFAVLFAAVLLPALLLAQDGKLRGRITDRDSGEPLVGANVFVEGTNLGAAADINGDFVILSVRPGAYSLRVSYVGYNQLTVSNVRVNANITTTQDFLLTSSAIQVQAVEIVAERPLIQRNTTNTVRITTQEDINQLPVRGVQNILALQAGVVQQAGNLYVRGGRSGEVAYYIDGAPTTNPLFNNNLATVIQEAVEEMQLQAGGYTAEFGGSNSGIVKTNLRSGGPQYKASVSVETDDFAKPGKKFLGTTSQGYRNVVATFGGPLPGVDKVRFFALYQNNFVRQRERLWLTPFSFELLSDTFDPRGPGQPLPGPIAFQENYLPKSWQDNHNAQGTLEFDLSPVKLRFSGSYQFTKQPNGGTWVNAIPNYFRQKRFSITEEKDLMLGLRATHVIDPSTYYEVSVSYLNRVNELTDPDFGNDWTKWTDSTANEAIGYTGFRSRWAGPNAYSVITGFTDMRNENSPNNGYQINKQSSIGGGIDLTRQMNKNWELKAGGRFDSWVMRQFNVGTITGYNAFLHGTYGEREQTFESAEARRAQLGKAGVVNSYGYDVDGNLVDDGLDAPYKPIFIAGYLQNKLEYRDVIVNIGLRYEYFKPNHNTFANPLNAVDDFDVDNDVINQGALVPAPTYQLLLPRISFSFPVTDATVFYAQFGKYAQMPSLNNLYQGMVTLSRTVSPSARGNAYLQPVGFLMTPERTTQYEMGIRQMISNDFAMTLSGFYKDTKDQLQVRNVVSDQGVALYRAYLNDDFGTVKGIELTLELRRTPASNLAARVNYTLSDARGTGSNPNGSFGIIEQGIGRQINSINPLLYNQTHRGTVLIDYRWPGEKADYDKYGPVLAGLGGSLLFSFNSGHPYTKIKTLASLGQSDAWSVGVYPTQDPRFSFPAEPINNSSTPFVFNIDLSISKAFALGPLQMEIYANVTNLLNTKHVLNVYPTTGSDSDDGWLTNPLAGQYTSIPNYAAFYKALNLDNRYSWFGLAERGQYIGGDIYGTPRQIRVGLRAEI